MSWIGYETDRYLWFKLSSCFKLFLKKIMSIHIYKHVQTGWWNSSNTSMDGVGPTH